jgi:hypothetical protein
MRGKSGSLTFIFSEHGLRRGNPGTEHGGGDHFPTHEMAMEKCERYLTGKRKGTKSQRLSITT